MRGALVAILIAATGGLLVAARATAGDVAVVVRPDLDLRRLAVEGAVGLMVPGAGETVSREGALSALVRGRVTSSLLGGRTGGEPLVTLSRAPGRRVTIYVSLPPEGTTPNVVRYPVAVVGGGYHGLLASSSTRIPGLVSVADVAPTAVALAWGASPPLRAEAGVDAVASLVSLDRRLAAAHDSRDGATAVLVAIALALVLSAIVLRSAVLARATIAAPLAALAVALALSASEVTSRPVVIAAVGGLTAPLAMLVAWRAEIARVVLAAFLACYLAVLAADPPTASLAVIGPQPDGGGRFFGITNEIETMVVIAVLAIAATTPPAWAVAVGTLAAVTIGWSRAGADGGGVLVLAAGLAVVALLRRSSSVTPRAATLAAALAAAASAGLILLDRAIGGESHVTRAVDSGPGGVLGAVVHRLDISWQGATDNAHTVAFVVVSLAAILVLALVGPRPPAAVALLVALVVSIMVNDTPADVLVTGALGIAAIVARERAARSVGRAAIHLPARGQPTRRSPVEREPSPPAAPGGEGSA